MSDNPATDRPRLTPVPGLAKVPGPPRRTTPHTPAAPAPATTAPAATGPVHDSAREGGQDAPPPPAAPAIASRPRVSDRSTGAVRDMSFTTPLLIRTKLREHAAKPDTTKAAVVLAAVEATAGRLADLVAAERGTGPAAGALFPDPASTARATGDPRVPESLRLTARNLAVLDDLVTRCGADDRSQLLTAALRTHLDAAPGS